MSCIEPFRKIRLRWKIPYNGIPSKTPRLMPMKLREPEQTIHADLSRDDDYTAYLKLDQLLTAQVPLSDPPHHDEMLFIIQHQIAELWIKLLIHEIRRAIWNLRRDALQPAVKNLSRVRHIQNQMYGQWKVLDTLTPSEYAEFRHVFGKASGFQSAQYRILEFILGNKDTSMGRYYKHQPEWHDRLLEALHSPGLYDEYLAYLARRGMPVPAAALERDFSEMRDVDPGVVAVLKEIYQNRSSHWARYEACEALMDIGNNFQFWRFHHMKTVERIIGHKPGSGGSSGVAFLKKAMDVDMFPELLQVRTEIGAAADD